MVVNPWEQHIDEDLLELYAMGRLPETQAAPLEEHLLLCEQCRESLTQLDDFVRALASAKPDPAPLPEGRMGIKTAPCESSPAGGLSGGEFPARKYVV
ncbi:MAG: hypothetical protein U5J83_08950 [Bryobacterales bacterium]|nr:hypothetical protein [Bryobacterales bacterium]